VCGRDTNGFHAHARPSAAADFSTAPLLPFSLALAASLVLPTSPVLALPSVDCARLLALHRPLLIALLSLPPHLFLHCPPRPHTRRPLLVLVVLCRRSRLPFPARSVAGCKWLAARVVFVSAWCVREGRQHIPRPCTTLGRSRLFYCSLAPLSPCSRCPLWCSRPRPFWHHRAWVAHACWPCRDHC
jgi:hypothetical protein